MSKAIDIDNELGRILDSYQSYLTGRGETFPTDHPETIDALITWHTKAVKAAELRAANRAGKYEVIRFRDMGISRPYNQKSFDYKTQRIAQLDAELEAALKDQDTTAVGGESV